MLWDAATVDVKVGYVDDQLLHCQIFGLDGAMICECSFIYAQNDSQRRTRVWTKVEELNQQMRNP